ncbi:hypothetical protein PLICRDRAFT_180379 [Plicaturopsis crispa FD-325 SS-3]|uniref:S-adenosyl-L-methionine-dependent methyltransferase n=1 Tax=Plicaturopsis crispa FD-325 SS-3 TaxID=944288 RepID=A0A0C9SW37_PLICR|nr:hypothetical protein PLICRDRAFT_180379 [Plicaturopsis crispa FD-325 SS-3]
MSAYPHHLFSRPVYEVDFVGSDDSALFRTVHGMRFNATNPRYMIPADEDARRRSYLLHNMVWFMFNGKAYIGPVADVLRSRRDHGQRHIIDLGTGGGDWAISIADEFPRVEVTGVDLAPIQPRLVPSNCTFDVCDLDFFELLYPPSTYDFIHARAMHTGISNYPRFLKEVGRMLRTGGMVLLIELDLEPMADGRMESELQGYSGLSGWFALWRAYHHCLHRLGGIDVTVPQHLGELLAEAGQFEHISTRVGDVPIGFWPRDPLRLTIGEIAWMYFDSLLPSMLPLFIDSGYSEGHAKVLIRSAQEDLYHPIVHMSTRLHIAWAFKK